MTKKTVHGSVIFTATVPTYLPPVIIDQFVDDSGELNYILANGNTSLASRYNSVWHPIKNTVQWKAKDTPIVHKQSKY